MKANRLLALASRAVLCAALATTAIACKKEGAREATRDLNAVAPVAMSPYPLNLLPQEASFVGGASLDALRKTKVWSAMNEARDTNQKDKKEYEDFKAQTGWDPLTTLSSIHFAAPGDADTSKEFAVVATTSAPLDEGKLVAYLEKKAKEQKHAVERVPYQGKTLYGLKEKTVDSWFALLDSKTIAVGGPKWIKKVVDLSAGQGSGVDKNTKMMGLVGRSNRGAVLWVAGDIPEAKGATPLGVTIKSLTAALDFPGNGFKLDATTTTNSPAEGKKLADLATQQLTQLKPLAAGMGLGALLDSLKVQQAAADVSFGVSLTEGQLNELVDKGKQLAAGMMNQPAGLAAGNAPKEGGHVKRKGKHR